MAGGMDPTEREQHDAWMVGGFKEGRGSRVEGISLKRQDRVP